MQHGESPVLVELELEALLIDQNERISDQFIHVGKSIFTVPQVHRARQL